MSATSLPYANASYQHCELSDGYERSKVLFQKWIDDDDTVRLPVAASRKCKISTEQMSALATLSPAGGDPVPKVHNPLAVTIPDKIVTLHDFVVSE